MDFGFVELEVDGFPPWNVQEEEVTVPEVRFVKPVQVPEQITESVAVNKTVGVEIIVTVTGCETLEEPIALLTVSVTVYVPAEVKQNGTGAVPLCEALIAPGQDHDHCDGFPLERLLTDTQVVSQLCPGVPRLKAATGAAIFVFAD